MAKRNDIAASINRTVGALFRFQVFCSAGILLLYRINPTNAGVVAFVLGTTAIHVGLWIFLSMMHHHFVLTPTGKKLEKINFANLLTLIRLSSIPTAALMLVLVQHHPVSYTHLRAHETPEHLVCRLLLEKKKNNNQATDKITNDINMNTPQST